MNTRHSNSDSIWQRLHRKRREILFALALTLAAVVYLFASGHQATDKAPIALGGETSTVQ